MEKTVTEHIRDHLYSQFFNNGRLNVSSLEELEKRWSKEFEDQLKIKWDKTFYEVIKYMKNRLIMGAIRYGEHPINDNPGLDYIKAMKTKIKNYEKNKNKENLVDLGNYALLEYESGDNYFSAQDDSEHCEKKK